MTKHYNNDVSKQFYDVLKVKESSIDEIDEVIQPSFETNPKIVKDGLTIYATGTNSLATTLLTSSANQDLYITGASISVIKDITSTSTASTITCTKNGASMTLISIGGITLTPQSETMSVIFTHPIKIDRGTSIVGRCGTNVANIKADYIIHYFLDEA